MKGRVFVPRPKRDGVEAEIVSFIQQFIEKNGYSPSVREIGAAVGFKSSSTVFGYLKKLEQEDKIHMNAEKNRTVQVAKTDEPKVTSVDSMGIIEVPVIGTVAAGAPLLAEENISDTFPLPQRFAKKSTDVFMLKVKGESMINAGILDGDFVIVAKQQTASQHEIIVAMIDGEATVKRFYRESDSVVKLLPENDALEPIIVNAADVQILGKVVGIFRDNIM